MCCMGCVPYDVHVCDVCSDVCSMVCVVLCS